MKFLLQSALSTVPTRQAILNVLKQEGSLDAQSLAAQLGVTAMAVRQHLYALQEQQLVSYEEEPRPFGRPAKMWRLTLLSNDFFSDGHAELSVQLIDAVNTTFGKKAVAQLFSAISLQQIETYRRRIPGRASLRRRLASLAEIRTAEGFMAEVKALDDGSFLFIENHCPIITAACAYPEPGHGPCRAEIEVFRNVLGSSVVVERTEYIVAGTRRCAYQVRATTRRKIDEEHPALTNHTSF